jgi:hypothetical protein
MISIPDLFIDEACEIIADTEKGIAGSKIVKISRQYALQFDKNIPYGTNPFRKMIKKSLALKGNLLVFSDAEKYEILKFLCNLEQFEKDERIAKLKIQLISRYGELDTEFDSIDETLIEETKHWLKCYPDALKLYKVALSKFAGGIFERNLLDDLRLSLETMLKSIFSNSKSLENQLSLIGSLIKSKGGSSELVNMFQKLVEYYAKYQNQYVKHNDNVIEEEIEFIIEITSAFMKHLIRLSRK